MPDTADVLRKLVGQDVTTSETGRPKLDLGKLPKPRWPKKLSPERTVVLDITPAENGEQWPTPRFEILIANLDSIGIAALQVGDPGCERLGRANDYFVKDAPDQRAALIGEALLWIGMDTSWRLAAAALDKPQVVIAHSRSAVQPCFEDTFIVDAGKHAPESKVLGPISVTSVAEAVIKALKSIGVNTKS